jgi:hypothetical protein
VLRKAGIRDIRRRNAAAQFLAEEASQQRALGSVRRQFHPQFEGQYLGLVCALRARRPLQKSTPRKFERGYRRKRQDKGPAPTARGVSSMSMRIVPLAYNEHGHRFPVSERASFWLVKAMRKGPGAPRQLWVEDQAMCLPIEDSMADLRELAGSGRFRLDPIDQDGVPVPGVPPAYVEVIDTAAAGAAAGAVVGAAALRNAALPVEAASVVPVPMSEFLRVIEVLALAHAHSNRDSNTNLAALIEATAVVVRAADGAGIASRAYMRNADLSDPEPVELIEAPEPPPALPAPTPPASLRDMITEKLITTACRGIDAFVAQKLGSAIARPTLPPAAAIATPPPAAAPTSSTAAKPTPTASAPATGDRRPTAAPTTSTPATARATAPAPAPAAPSSPATATPAADTPAAGSSSPTTSPTDATPADPPPGGAELAAAAASAEQHLRTILNALTPEEHSQISTLVALAPPDQMTAWLAFLAGMSVEDAVATIRANLPPQTLPTTPPTEPTP